MRLIIAATIAALLPLQAIAQQSSGCARTADVYAILMQKYGEARMGVGMSSAGVLVELWRNVETGTWTTVVTNSQGISCIVAEGNEWVVSEPEPQGDPA